jgi:hypothetical protein
VICCYLGFTSSQVAAILNMMGYDAQVALHGLSAWTLDPEIARFRIDDPQNWRDYPVEGAATGPVVATTLPGKDALAVSPTQLPETGGVLWPIPIGLGLFFIVIGGIIQRKFGRGRQ